MIVEGANLILKPGVTIRFGEDELTQQRGTIQLFRRSDGTKNAGIIAIGTKDSLITFKPDSYSYGGQISYDNNGRNGLNQDSVCNWCVFENINVVYPPSISNSQFFGGGAYGGNIETSNFVQSSYIYSIGGWKYSNIIDKRGLPYYTPSELNFISNYTTIYNYIGNYNEYSLAGFYAESGIQEFEKIYLGTGSIKELKELNIDGFDGNQSGVFKYNNTRLTPYVEAPAIVWKVEVNGKNAWDEYDDLDTLGVGKIGRASCRERV